MNIQKVFGYNLKKQRLAREWTQAILAGKAGTGSNYIAMIEYAVKFPSSDMIERIANALEIEPCELFQPVEKEFSNPWNWGESDNLP